MCVEQPSAATRFPVAAPGLSPMWRRVGPPAAKVHGRVAVGVTAQNRPRPPLPPATRVRTTVSEKWPQRSNTSVPNAGWFVVGERDLAPRLRISVSRCQ